MKKLKTKNGLTAYKVTLEENQTIGGFGICDECGKETEEGYLVPVLNHYQCEGCFENFSKRAKRYPEDDHIEQRRISYFENRIPLDKEG